MSWNAAVAELSATPGAPATTCAGANPCGPRFFHQVVPAGFTCTTSGKPSPSTSANAVSGSPSQAPGGVNASGAACAKSGALTVSVSGGKHVTPSALHTCADWRCESPEL